MSEGSMLLLNEVAKEWIVICESDFTYLRYHY